MTIGFVRLNDLPTKLLRVLQFKSFFPSVSDLGVDFSVFLVLQIAQVFEPLIKSRIDDSPISSRCSEFATINPAVEGLGGDAVLKGQA